MSSTDTAPAQAPSGGVSPRVALARRAREAALGVAGVAELDSGVAGQFLTAGGGERVPGVTCVVAPEGGYDVSLRLVCDLVPLRAVADRVRAAVQEAGVDARVAVQSVTILISDVTEAGEAA